MGSVHWPCSTTPMRNLPRRCATRRKCSKGNWRQNGSRKREARSGQKPVFGPQLVVFKVTDNSKLETKWFSSCFRLLHLLEIYSMPKMNMVEAINMALRQEME